MALTPRSGFSATTSGPNDVPTDIPNTQTDVVNNMPFITDAALNKYAIDTSAYPNTTKTLVGFMRGKRVLVTYYRLMRQGGANVRTNIADYPTVRDILTNEYQKILNLEITLPKGFDFETNPDQASIGVMGEAMFYPNMNPNVGDVFTMGMGDGRIGVMQLSAVTPTSWRNDRVYRVRFMLQSFMDHSDSNPIEGSVTSTFVFDKANYLGNTAALLSETTYLQLQKIRVLRGSLIKFYHQTFLSADINSYLRPDGVFDPYVVTFFANKVTMSDLHLIPKNPMGRNNKLYKTTLWARLEDRYNTNLMGLYYQYRTEPYHQTKMGVFATELVGYSILAPEGAPDGLTPYIFSSAFYTGDTLTMSTWELRIYNAIVQRDCGDLTTLFTEYFDTVQSLSKDEMFYRIPLYIHLMDMALQSRYREIDAPSMAYASSGG